MLLHYAHNSAHYALHTALNNTVLWTVLITHTANIDSWSRSCWWQGRRWHLGVTKIVCLYVTGNLVQIHFAIWDKYILQFETNTFCNLRQSHFVIWDKYICSNRDYWLPGQDPVVGRQWHLGATLSSCDCSDPLSEQMNTQTGCTDT